MDIHSNKSLRVCYFGTYRANYSRNQIMIDGLRAAGVDVVTCHTPLWQSVQDRVNAVEGDYKHMRFWWRVMSAYWRLLCQYRRVGDYDVLIVGYPGQFDVYLARLLSRLRRKPLVWDVFMSIYLVAQERGLIERNPSMGRLIRRVERRALALPHLLIQDTAAYVNWFNQTHKVAPERFRLVPTGADDRVFRPAKNVHTDRAGFTALYYGTYIPNHGVEHIIKAARILRDESDIHFELIGRGPCRAEAEALAQRHQLTNVTFVDWVDKSELPQRAARANVCLGAFGTTPQSIMTVQNKIYEGLAMGRPVITGDSPTVRQTLTHGEHIYLCQRADPVSLARAISTLRDDNALCLRLAREGQQRFEQDFGIEAIGMQFRYHLEELLTEGTPTSRKAK
jgi:glycosyltransferase involved in cell wall biosynthesis